MQQPADLPPTEPPASGEGGSAATPVTNKWARGLYLTAGIILTGIGIVGAFLPLLPTTIFLIMAAWCFGRSSPRFEAWLLNHPQFGPPLRAWRSSGAIPRRAKYLAFTGMAAGYAIFYVSAAPRWPAALLVAAVMLCSAIYVGTRPEGA
jgi:uncharacterized membrane protein YbaN (DUF454 family)